VDRTIGAVGEGPGEWVTAAALRVLRRVEW